MVRLIGKIICGVLGILLLVCYMVALIKNNISLADLGGLIIGLYLLQILNTE